MSNRFSASSGSTLLQQVLGDRASQLLPAHLTTMDELMVWEQASALEARRWAFSGRRRREVLGVSFLIALHRRMFDGIWSWAGQLRRSDHPDGVRWPTIGIELNDLIGEVRFWRERKLYAADELALRLHHRLVRIRSWEGGNGSHARMAADALVVAMDHPPFVWGHGDGESASTARDRYVAALREADSGTFGALREFARITG